MLLIQSKSPCVKGYSVNSKAISGCKLQALKQYDEKSRTPTGTQTTH